MIRRRIRRSVIKKRKKFRKRAVATGAAAAISLGTGVSLHKALAAFTLDAHQLPVAVDTDADLLADAEEAALAYLGSERDQNRNGILDGVELAGLCAANINDLPLEGVAGPGETCKKEHFVYGLETCDQCPTVVNMGFVEIINPTRALTVLCPFISLHYMEHGSFSYAGTEHEGRLDVPGLLEALELRLPHDPNDHQLSVPKDADADLLSNAEETAIGYLPFNPDQNHNAIPDGMELAKRCARAVAQIPQYFQPGDPLPDETYKTEHALDGLERCHICGQWVHMGGWEIINPKLNLKYPDPNDPLNGIFLPDLALHYMEHGSLDCFGDIHKGRADIARLLRVLELRFPGDPDSHQLALDYVLEPAGQLAPDANDHDLLADSEELAASFNLYDPDQDDNLTPDGIELAMQFAEGIDALPVYDPHGPSPGPEPDEPYKVNNFQRGLELCEICGASVNMGWWQVVNPKLGLSMAIYDVTCHYMSHGSLSYSGLQFDSPHEPLHNGRVKVALLVRLLQMPHRCGHLGTVYLPGDHNKDCCEDFADFTDFADKWLQSTDPAQDDNGQ